MKVSRYECECFGLFVLVIRLLASSGTPSRNPVVGEGQVLMTGVGKSRRELTGRTAVQQPTAIINIINTRVPGSIHYHLKQD